MRLPPSLLARFLLALVRFLRVAVKRAGALSLKKKSNDSKTLPPKRSAKQTNSQRGSMTRAFDKIFEEEGRGLPVPFLRALAKHESSSDPSEAKGPAWGLLQVGIDKRAGNVLKSYNERHGESLHKVDMLNPRLNVRVAADLLSRIVELYKAEGLKADWQNGNFIGLVVSGWNAGYSRKVGVIHTIRFLKKRGIPITLSAVYANTPEAAPKTKAGRAFVKRMGQQKRRDWTRRVVASTFTEQGKSPSPEVKGKAEWVPIAMLALLLLR